MDTPSTPSLPLTTSSLPGGPLSTLPARPDPFPPPRLPHWPPALPASPSRSRLRPRGAVVPGGVPCVPGGCRGRGRHRAPWGEGHISKHADRTGTCLGRGRHHVSSTGSRGSGAGEGQGDKGTGWAEPWAPSGWARQQGDGGHGREEGAGGCPGWSQHGGGTGIIQVPQEGGFGAQGCRRHGSCLETPHFPGLIPARGGRGALGASRGSQITVRGFCPASCSLGGDQKRKVTFESPRSQLPYPLA